MKGRWQLPTKAAPRGSPQPRCETLDLGILGLVPRSDRAPVPAPHPGLGEEDRHVVPMRDVSAGKVSERCPGSGTECAAHGATRRLPLRPPLLTLLPLLPQVSFQRRRAVQRLGHQVAVKVAATPGQGPATTRRPAPPVGDVASRQVSPT